MTYCVLDAVLDALVGELQAELQIVQYVEL